VLDLERERRGERAGAELDVLVPRGLRRGRERVRLRAAQRDARAGAHAEPAVRHVHADDRIADAGERLVPVMDVGQVGDDLVARGVEEGDVGGDRPHRDRERDAQPVDGRVLGRRAQLGDGHGLVVLGVDERALHDLDGVVPRAHARRGQRHAEPDVAGVQDPARRRPPDGEAGIASRRLAGGRRPRPRQRDQRDRHEPDGANHPPSVPRRVARATAPRTRR
jgi:hypothetical protein